jgi:hypothetical protein
MLHTWKHTNSTFQRHFFHNFPTGGSVLTLPCSQVVTNGPSLPSASTALISPLITLSRFPTDSSTHSISRVVPTGTDRRYVTLSVRLTPRWTQNPGLAMKCSGSVVHKSNKVAVQPPWRLDMPFVWTCCTVKRKLIRGCGKAAE